MNIFDEIAEYASKGYTIKWDFGGGLYRKFQEWRIILKPKNKYILEDFARMLKDYGKITELHEGMRFYTISFITNDKSITAMKRRNNYWNDLVEYFTANARTSARKYDVGFMLVPNDGYFIMYPRLEID